MLERGEPLLDPADFDRGELSMTVSACVLYGTAVAAVEVIELFGDPNFVLLMEGCFSVEARAKTGSPGLLTHNTESKRESRSIQSVGCQTFKYV